jgi:uncharacterized protein (TIGR02001 family)
MRLLFAVAAALVVLGAARPAAAQSWADSWRDRWVGTMGGEVGVTSDNRSKFASKSGGDPAAFAGVYALTPDGAWYVEGEAETIRDSSGSDAELTFAAGWRPQAFGFDFDLAAARKVRLGARPGADTEAWEFTADAARAIGPFEGRLRLQQSPDSAGSSGAWVYYEARLRWDVAPRWTLDAQVGTRDYEDDADDYSGASLGAVYAATDRLDIDLRLIDTDRTGEDDDPALVVSLIAGF